MKPNMKQSAYLSFSCDSYGYVRELKNKSIKGVFAEAKRVIAKENLIGVIQIKLVYSISFAPVPSYAGDCKTIEFIMYKKDRERPYMSFRD